MKQQKQLIALLLLVVLAIVAWIWNSRQTPQSGTARTVESTYTPMNVDNPAIRWWQIDKVRNTEYKAGGRNPFSDVAPAPPVAKVPQPGDKDYVKPPEPPPPPLELPPNMKFLATAPFPMGPLAVQFFPMAMKSTSSPKETFFWAAIES